MALNWRLLADTVSQFTVTRKVGNNPGVGGNGRDVDGSASRTRVWF